MEIIRELNKLADRLSLEQRALDGARAWVTSGELGLSTSVAEDLHFSLLFHKLCFKSGALTYVYLETRLSIAHDGGDVGHYTLYSSLDGDPIDDNFVITDEGLSATS